MATTAHDGRNVLCFSCSFAPETLPTAIRADQLLRGIADKWRVRVITASRLGHTADSGGVFRIEVSNRNQKGVLQLLARARLGKLTELLLWPDPDVLWAPSALLAALRAHRTERADVILVFMMPYSAGLVGIALKRLTKVPLVLNLDDSPTCTDMHPWFPSALHTIIAQRLEDMYAAEADAVIYVSETTRARVAARLPEELRGKLKLLRYGADVADLTSTVEPLSNEHGVFTIRYVGGMNGWHALLDDEPHSLVRSVYRACLRLGRVTVAPVDSRSSSPAFIGRAVRRVIERHPEWKGRMRVEVYGNQFPDALIRRVLTTMGIADEVMVAGPVSHEEAVRLTNSAELLFMTLPARLDGTRGGRISAKTYEYLATTRPILAALPPGENRDFLTGRAGVVCCDPMDEDAMVEAVEKAAVAFFSGNSCRYDRRHLAKSLSYEQRSQELLRLLDEITGTARTTSAGVDVET